MTARILPASIEEQMKTSYLDYAMSVIIARAVPDVGDGLKPVQRRILFAMQELGLFHNTPYKKSARVVGEVLGKYHPHGDVSVYDALVRLAQDFTMRYPLVDGQGNFGSLDGDPPAAMRYTEVRLAAISDEVLADIGKETVDFVPNFDNSLKEPVVLPSRLPNLLVNGSSGIAVGMATNIPPHNLTEICHGIVYLVDHPDASLDDLLGLVKGPDFPTGAIIMGDEGIRSAYATGRGQITLRARTTIEESGGRPQLIITELPYQVNKAVLVSRIAELAREKKISGISEVRDESDRQGVRVVVELKKEARPEHVLNALFRYTSMQQGFFINMLALVQGQPRLLSLKEALQYFIDFRFNVLKRRSEYELRLAKERLHILDGLRIALDNIDQVINLIRSAANAEAARGALMTTLGLSVAQSQAILDMQLRRLANLERQKILDEYEEVGAKIGYLEGLLADPIKILTLLKEDIFELIEKHGDPRRTAISREQAITFAEEDLIPHQDLIVFVTRRGYVKSVPLSIHRVQQRGGRGISGMSIRESDLVKLVLAADSHDNILFLTTRGRLFSLKCYDLPSDSSRSGKGAALANFFPIGEDETVSYALPVREFLDDSYIILATAKGEFKRMPLGQFNNVRSSGIIAMDLAPGDEIVAATIAGSEDEIIALSQKSQAIRFASAEIRVSHRASGGVRGISRASDDRVVGLDTIVAGGFLLTVTSQGYGKLTPLNSYPVQHRGGKGVSSFKLSEKTGEITAARVVRKDQSIILVSASGIVTLIRSMGEGLRNYIPVQGRRRHGARLVRLDEGDILQAVTCFGEPGTFPPTRSTDRPQDSSESPFLLESEDILSSETQG